MRQAALVALALGAAPAAHGAELISGQTVVIGPEDVVHDDLYVAANRVEILGTVDGDLVLLAGEARVAGVVTGDILAAAGDLAVTGDVVGSVRAAGGTLVLTAEIAEDAVLAGGDVVLPMQGRVGRDLVLAAGDASVEGIVGNDVIAAARALHLESQVGRDVVARTDELVVGDGARIGGDLRYAADEEVGLADRAIVRGELVRIGAAEPGFAERLLWGLLGWVRALLGLFVAGLLLVAIFPGFTARAETALTTRPWASLAAGLLAVVGVPLVAVLVLFAGGLVGGWWLGLVALAILVLAMLGGVLVAGVTVGHWLLAKVGRPSAHAAWALLAGLVLLLLVGAVPILGGIVVLAATLLGLGAMAIAGISADRAAIPGT